MGAKLRYSLLSAIFILGYTSLSFELIILRQIINFVGSNTLITSIVMAFILLFLSVGYYWGSVISFAKCPIRRITNKIFLFLSVWYTMACSYYMIEVFFYGLYFLGVKTTIYQVFTLSALFLVAPSVGLGFVTATIGRVIHHFNSDYTGRFMAVDTLGSVAGSLVTTLVLMPLFGVFSAVVMIVFLTSLLLVVFSRAKAKYVSLVYCLFLTMGAYVVASEKFIDANNGVVLDNAIARVEMKKGDFENGVTHSTLMMINGSFSSKLSDKEEFMFPYVRYINDVYIKNLAKDKVHNILVLGAGGFTVGQDDERNRYTYLDIIKELPEIVEKETGGSLTENKKFVFEDAYLFLLRSREKYDIIVVDVYSAKRSIPANFVTADFFEMVKQHLSADGMAIFNIITSASFKTKFSRNIDYTLRFVFPYSLNRQVILYDGLDWKGDDSANVIYTYYNRENNLEIYTNSKNMSVWGDK